MPALFIFSLCGLTAALANRSMDPLVTAVARDFGVATGAAAAVVSMYALPYAFSQPVLGPVGDFYGKGRMLRFCLWLQVFSMALVIVSPNLTVLMIARFIGGFAGGGIMPIAMAMIGDRYPPAERQQAIARYVSVALIGMMMSSAIAGVLAVYINWRGIFVLALVFAIFSALLVTMYIHEPPAPARRMKIADAISGYKILFANRRAFVCFGAVFLEGVALYGVTPYVAPLLEERQRGGPLEAGLALTGLALGAFLFTATVKHSLKLFTRYQLMFIGGFFTACGPFSLVFDMRWEFYCAGFVLAGIGYMMVHNSIQAEVAELAPALRGSAFAMHSCSFFTGQSLGPILFGLTAAATGASIAALLFGLVLLVIGPVISVIFMRMQGKPS